jgi:uncharacterized protein YjiS (DUF1127 family)
MNFSMSEARALAADGQSLAKPLQVARLARRLIAWIRTERRIGAGIDQLNALDDHLLADIGLSRDTIAYASRYGRLPDGWIDGGR